MNSVGIYLWVSSSMMEVMMMAKTVLAPNPVPRSFVPMIRRRIFMTKYVTDKGIKPPVVYCSSAEKPVTPPPSILFGVRNNAHPKAYKVRPRVMIRYYFTTVR